MQIATHYSAIPAPHPLLPPSPLIWLAIFQNFLHKTISRLISLIVQRLIARYSTHGLAGIWLRLAFACDQELQLCYEFVLERDFIGVRSVQNSRKKFADSNDQASETPNSKDEEDSADILEG